MNGLFDLDSPLMRTLNKVADIVILNLLTLICCIPVVTIGASLTALHYVSLKMARNEEGYIIRSFFKSFKQNFKQATGIWLIFLAIFGILFVDFWILKDMMETFYLVIKGILLVATVVTLFAFTFVFPVLAKFDNTVLRTIKNAFFISILQLPRTVLIIILNIIPLLLLYSVKSAPFVLLFGFSVPALAAAYLYDKFFQKLEGQVEGNQVEADVEGELAEVEEEI